MQGGVGGLAAGGVKLGAVEGHGLLGAGGVGHRSGSAAPRALAGGDHQKAREGLAADRRQREGDLHAAEVRRRPEGQVVDVGRGAVEILGRRSHAGADGPGAGAVVEEGALGIVRQGLEGHIVQPRPRDGLAEVGEVRQHRLSGLAGVEDVAVLGDGGLDVQLHRAGEVRAVPVLAGEGDADHAVKALRRHEGDIVQLGVGHGAVPADGAPPAVEPVIIERALVGGGQGEADGAHPVAGHGLAVGVEVAAAEGDDPRAVILILDGLVQGAGDLDDHLAGVLDAGGAVARVADGHRAHIALCGDEGDVVQALAVKLLRGGDPGGVVQLVLIVPVQHALGGGGQGEDHIAQVPPGLGLADPGEILRLQLQGHVRAGGQGHILGLGVGERDLNASLEGTAIGGGSGKGDGGLLPAEGLVGHKGQVPDVRPPGGGGGVVGNGAARARAGVVRGLVPLVNDALGRGDGEARDGNQPLPQHRLALGGQQALQGGEFQRRAGADPRRPRDDRHIGGHVHCDFRSVDVSARLNLDCHCGVTGLAGLHHDVLIACENVDVALVVHHGGAELGIAGGGAAIEFIVRTLADGLGLIFQHGDLCGQQFDTADGDLDLMGDAAHGCGNRSRAGRVADNIHGSACSRPRVLDHRGDRPVRGVPDHAEVICGGVRRLQGRHDADALAAGGIGLQLKFVVRRDALKIVVVAGQHQIGDRAGRPGRIVRIIGIIRAGR